MVDVLKRPIGREQDAIIHWNITLNSLASSAGCSSGSQTPAPAAGPAAGAAAKRPWPNTLTEQMRAIADLLTSTGRPITLQTIEAQFTGRGPWKRRIPQILEALAALGRARGVDGAWVVG